jgi:hypothetical protein
MAGKKTRARKKPATRVIERRRILGDKCWRLVNPDGSIRFVGNCPSVPTYKLKVPKKTAVVGNANTNYLQPAYYL